jgi:hypothetical protein
MEETRGEQVTFGWAGEGTADTTDGAAAPRPPRGVSARGERKRRPVPAKAAAPLPPDDELWNVHATARFLRRSVSWVYHRAEDGTLPVKRIAGWGVRFIPAELRAWVQDGGGCRR